MEGIISLSNPILIDGREISELKYDTDLITADLFAEAEGIKNKATRQVAKGTYAGAMELDYSFHLYLGAAAVVAANPTWGFEEVLRVKGHDLKKLTGIGRSFMTESDESPEDSSEELSEITSEYSTSQDMSYGDEESMDL